MSVNQLKTWQKCRKKYLYDYVHQLHWPTDPSNFRLGRDIHKLLDYQSRGLDCRVLLQDLESDTKSCWETLMASPFPHFPVIANEWGFQLPVSSAYLIGRIDRIARHPDTGEIWIIDWKTGTGVPKFPESDWQTMVYSAAVIAAYQDLELPDLSPKDACFAYVEVKETVRDIVIPLDTRVYEHFIHQIETTVSEIQSASEYPLPESCPDHYCPYESICGIRVKSP
ncbi:MAG: PD-(D/E)XK nuclease family protein [Vampirovibrio sp.]|nr:PD-(D/E)XK nuclease family protein [Vampirovibrio sp.]